MLTIYSLIERYILVMPASRQSAFSLIEAAIVLGIVGLVIGGIWTAASAVRTNMKHAELQQGILQIQSAVSSLYRHARPSAPTQVTELVVTRKAVPPHWVVAATGALDLPLGGPTDITIDSNFINIRMTNTNTATCRRILMEHNKYGAKTEWGIGVENDYTGSEDIYLGTDPTYNNCNFPISYTRGTLILFLPY